MMLSSVIFFSFHFPPWFSSTLALHQWMFEGETEMTKIAVESSVCYSKQILLNIIGRGLLHMTEEWARAPVQNRVSRKIVISREELCSCSTGGVQATNFLLSTGFLVFKELYVGSQVSHTYYFEGKIGEIHWYEIVLKYNWSVKLNLYP